MSAIVAMQQDIKHMSKQLDQVAKTSETVIRNEESIKSAHKRIGEVESSLSADIKELKDDNKWLWRTAVGGVLTAIGGLVKQLF